MSTAIKAVHVDPVAEAPPSPPEGVYYDLSDEDYNSWTDAFRSGWATKIDQGLPLSKLRWQIDHPKPSTDDQVLGTIVHAAVLEPERFERDFARGPDVKLNTKSGVELWERVKKQNPGMELLRFHDYNTAQWIVESVWERPEHEHVRNHLLSCEDREVTVIWIDESTGLKCRARIDGLGRAVRLKTDLKTTQSADPRDFEKSLVNFGYDIQAALYQRACDYAGWDIEDSSIIALEKEPPFLCQVLPISESVVKVGDEKLGKAMETFAECSKSGIWPGYPPRSVVISYPEWHWRQLSGK